MFIYTVLEDSYRFFLQLKHDMITTSLYLAITIKNKTIICSPFKKKYFSLQRKKRYFYSLKIGLNHFIVYSYVTIFRLKTIFMKYECYGLYS